MPVMTMTMPRAAESDISKLREARLARFDRQEAVREATPKVPSQEAPPADPKSQQAPVPARDARHRQHKRSKAAVRDRQEAMAPAPAADLTEDDELRRAIALSLGQDPDAVVGTSASSSTSSTASSAATVANTSTSNSLWNPPRYVPSAMSESNRELKLVESVEVRDGGYVFQPASAFLDTGNQHVTIVDTDFARRHALWSPNANGPFAQAEQWTQIHGVVPGASTRAPIVTIALRIRGHDLLIPAAVSEMRGHDLLIGIDVLKQLFAAGFMISAGSL